MTTVQSHQTAEQLQRQQVLVDRYHYCQWNWGRPAKDRTDVIEVQINSGTWFRYGKEGGD